MQVILYNNASDPEVFDKSLTVIGSATATPYESISVESPTLILSDLSVSNISRVNYMYIEEFGRYYYMTEAPEIVNGNQLRITGHIDVLMSHKAAIRNADIIANRSASNNNPYIIYSGRESIKNETSDGLLYGC